MAVMMVVCLAGCIDDGDSTAPGSMVVQPPDFDFATAIQEVHDHADPALHTGAFGLRRVGWDPLMSASQPGMPTGGHADLSVATDDAGRTWAFVANFGPHRAVSIAETTDPTAPRHVSDYAPTTPVGLTLPGGGSYWDVNAHPSSDLIIVSAQASAATDVYAPDLDRVGGGLYLVNTQDKGNPYTESFKPVFDPDALIPVGIHNARFFDINGTDHVAATTANGDTILFRVEGEPGARTLAQVSRVTGTHDTTVQVHPFTGQVLLYGAQGGVFITDISDPEDPELLASVPNGPELSAYHLIVPSDVVIDGRHFTISGTETTTGTPPFITVLDTTDPTAPFIVSTWQTPFDTDVYLPGPYRWATHNFDFDHGRIYLGHYHAGVWVIDVSSETNAIEPVTMAYYQPHELPLGAVPRTPTAADTPAVWTALRHTDGFVYASDANGGLYILTTTVEPSPLEGHPVFTHNQR